MGAEVTQSDGRSAQLVQIGNAATTNYGNLRTTDEASALFNDSFEVDDLTDRWTLKTSTGTSTVASGNLTCASSTTASAYGGRFTQAAFTPRGINCLVGGILATFPTAVIANSARVVGFGVLAATPTIALPVTDGIAFYIDGTGALLAKVYAGSVEVSSTALSAYNPVSGVPIGLAFQYRTDSTLFFINTLNSPVATIPVVAPNIEALPFFAISIAGATPPGVSATMVCRAAAVGDSGKNSNSIADGTFAWRTATVTKGGALVQKQFSKPELDWQATSGLTPLATTTSTPLTASAGAGLKNYCTAAQFYNTSATVSTTVTILDGAVVLWTGYLPATTAALPVVAVMPTFPSPLQGSAATAMNVQLGTVSASVYYNAQGYKGA